MKLVIFAGGIGTRLWPLSRENSPKQFDKLFNGKSTLEMAIERVEPHFGIENILIQTVENFKNSVIKQVPHLPKENIIIEPARRNLGPAVCHCLLELKKRGHSGPMAILWADHLIERPEEFIKALKTGKELIAQNPERFVFLGEKPRFANNNLGWIHVGDKTGTHKSVNHHSFKGWKYKPETKDCDDMFNSGNFYWNPGYFITSIEFLINQYKKLAPETYKSV